MGNFKKFAGKVVFGARLVARETGKTLKGTFGPRSIEQLKAQEARLKLKVKIAQQKRRIQKLKQKGGGGFQAFATGLSKTRFAKQGLGGGSPGFDLPLAKKLITRRVSKRKIKRKLKKKLRRKLSKQIVIKLQ